MAVNEETCFCPHNVENKPVKPLGYAKLLKWLCRQKVFQETLVILFLFSHNHFTCNK